MICELGIVRFFFFFWFNNMYGRMPGDLQQIQLSIMNESVFLFIKDLKKLKFSFGKKVVEGCA